jgi:DNA-binding NarL/FixJ family response regulator
MKNEYIIVDGKKLTQPMVDIICLFLHNVQVKNLHHFLKKAEGTVKTHLGKLHDRLQLHTVQEIINWARPAKIRRKLLQHCTVDLASLQEG